MSDYPYRATHIEGLTPEIVRAVIYNPEVTYYDLDALTFAVINSSNEDLGITSSLLDEISLAINDIQFNAHGEEISDE